MKEISNDVADKLIANIDDEKNIPTSNNIINNNNLYNNMKNIKNIKKNNNNNGIGVAKNLILDPNKLGVETYLAKELEEARVRKFIINQNVSAPFKSGN